ncbi:hypothetical protein ANCCAN_17486 [Ancylostoma caninum]|uniref:Uncharacterized protein n=1 Tax=Ancylostoma caninum TaxID=29170 RepID=A0A368G0Y3_ANCCA|nr:hypothetical protein ANCCAN_17486 [Ancylostoma caninum]
MASFASFLDTDSFDFSVDYTYGPITKEDVAVWNAFYRARERATPAEKQAYIRSWLADNEAHWKGSSLRVDHARHKARRALEAEPAACATCRNPTDETPVNTSRRSTRIAESERRRALNSPQASSSKTPAKKRQRSSRK